MTHICRAIFSSQSHWTCETNLRQRSEETVRYPHPRYQGQVLDRSGRHRDVDPKSGEFLDVSCVDFGAPERGQHVGRGRGLHVILQVFIQGVLLRWVSNKTMLSLDSKFVFKKSHGFIQKENLEYLNWVLQMIFVFMLQLPGDGQPCRFAQYAEPAKCATSSFTAIGCSESQSYVVSFLFGFSLCSEHQYNMLLNYLLTWFNSLNHFNWTI